MALTQVSTSGIKDATVATADIAADAITRDKIADDVIASEHFIAGEVDANALASNSVTNAKVADDAIGIAELSATGTASSSTFLRGDNSWTTVNTDLIADNSPQLGGNLASNGNAITMADNDKIKLGAGSDLELYHDGSNSYIQNTTGTELIIHNQGNAKIQIKPQNSYPVELYYNASKKLETTSAGVTVSHSDDSGATTLKLENNSTHNSQNPKVKIAVDLASGKDGGSIEFIRGNNYQSSAAADSEIVISPTKNDTNQEAVRITQDWFRLHSNCSGIQFNSDTASANALNDYEEGTFSPSINTGYSVAYNTRNGNYIKIGKLCYFRLYIDTSSISGSSDQTDARINGLPFTSSGQSLGFGVTVPWIYGLGQNVQNGYVQGGGNYIELLNNPSGGNREHTNADSCWDQNDLRISIAGCYEVA